MGTVPFTPTVHAPNGLVCSADHLASSAGAAMLRRGGTAVDAVIADCRFCWSRVITQAMAMSGQ